MEADNGTTEQNQKIPFHVYNYYLSEKNENQNKKEKSYYINKEDKEKVLQKIHYTELKKYLENEKCSEQSIEKYYENKKIEPFEKEVKIDTITKKENCTVDNGKEEINEEFKNLVEIIGYKNENEPKSDNPILPKTEENKKDETKEGKLEEEKGNNHENKNKPIENEPDKKDEEQKKELNNNENKEGEKNEEKNGEKKDDEKNDKEIKDEKKEEKKVEIKDEKKEEKKAEIKEEKKEEKKAEIKEEKKEEVKEEKKEGEKEGEKNNKKEDEKKEKEKEEDNKDNKNIGEVSKKEEITGDIKEKKQEDQNQKEICQGNNIKNDSLKQQTNNNPKPEENNQSPQGQTMNSPQDSNLPAEENVNNPKKEENPEIKKKDNDPIEDKNSENPNEKKLDVPELTQNEIHEKGKDENNQENQTENQNESLKDELNEQKNNPTNEIKKDGIINLDENEENKESKENKDIAEQESTKKKPEVNEKKVNETTSDNININDIKHEIKTSEDNPKNLLQQKTIRDQNEIKEEGDTKKSKIEENKINNDEEKEKTNENQQNNQNNQNNNNNNINEITPEMLLQFQQMQQQMINEYLLKNGYENKFVNDYYNLTQTQNEEPDYGLPQVKNGRIQLNPDINSIGLQNVGATCYMNATLECLIHIKELSEILLSAFFFSYPRSDETFASKHKLSLQYIEILSQVFFPKLHGNSKYFAPYEFKTLISEMNPLFAGIQANDAKDLLQFVLENLHSELKMATQFFSEYNIDQRDQDQAKQYFYNSYVSQNKSPIHDILYGVNKIESICLKCNTHKYNFQSYNLLYFPLKEAKRIAVLRKKEKDPKFDEKKYILTLEDCFAHSEQTELFTGDYQMYCNECHCLADAKYQTVLFTTPNVISIVLNRGRANRDFQEDFKFGLDLDIKEYIHNPNYKHGKYYLIGMVVHAGGSDMSGHFFAYCRMDKKAKWFCYNDAFVSECNDIEKKLVENKPYILFYHYDNDANQNNQ